MKQEKTVVEDKREEHAQCEHSAELTLFPIVYFLIEKNGTFFVFQLNKKESLLPHYHHVHHLVKDFSSIKLTNI